MSIALLSRFTNTCVIWLLSTGTLGSPSGASVTNMTPFSSACDCNDLTAPTTSSLDDISSSQLGGPSFEAVQVEQFPCRRSRRRRSSVCASTKTDAVRARDVRPPPRPSIHLKGEQGSDGGSKFVGSNADELGLKPIQLSQVRYVFEDDDRAEEGAVILLHRRRSKSIGAAPAFDLQRHDRGFVLRCGRSLLLDRSLDRVDDSLISDVLDNGHSWRLRRGPEQFFGGAVEVDDSPLCVRDDNGVVQTFQSGVRHLLHSTEPSGLRLPSRPTLSPSR